MLFVFCDDMVIHMSSKGINVNFRTSKKTVELLERFVEGGEARNRSEALNKIIDRFFHGREVSP